MNDTTENDLFIDVPDTVSDETFSALEGLDGPDEQKRALYKAAREYTEAKLALVKAHIESNHSPRRVTVEWVHSRANGPSITVIPESDGQAEAIRETVDGIVDVDVINTVGDWLIIA